MATPTVFTEVGERLPRSVESLGGLAEAISYANANGTAEEPVEIILANPVVISNTADFTLDKTGFLSQTHGAFLDFNNQNGKVRLVGRGVKDPKSDIPIFIDAPCNLQTDTDHAAGGANAKGVKWDNDSGNAPVPKVVSSRLFGFTNADENVSLTAKLNRVDKAFKGLHVEIHLHPDTIGKGNTGENSTQYQSLSLLRQVNVLEEKRSLIFLPGEFPSEYNKNVSHDTPNVISYYAPFLFQSDTYISAKPGAKIYQPPRANDDKVALFNPKSESLYMENVTLEHLDLYGGQFIPGNTTGGALSSSGTRAVIGSGACYKFKCRYNRLFGMTGYGLTLVASGDPALMPIDAEIDYNELYNMWSQVINCIRGYNVKLRHNKIINRTVPNDVVVGGLLQTAWGGGFMDMEGNNLSDFTIHLEIFGNTFEFPRVMPATVINPTTNPASAPFQFNAQSIIVQGIENGIEDVKIIKNEFISHPMNNFGVVNHIAVEGVKDLIIKDNPMGDTYNYPMTVSNCRNVDIDGISTRSSGYARHILLSANANLKLSGLSAVGNSNPVIEEEVYYAVVAENDTVYTARPFGTFQGTDIPHQFRWRTHYGRIYGDGLKFLLDNAVIEGIAVTIPAYPDATHTRKMTTTGTFGVKTAMTFSNASVTDNGVNITAHGLYTGQAVNVFSGGVLPVISDRDTTGKMFIIAETANRIKFANNLYNALAGTVETINTAASSGTHSIRPYNVNILIIAPGDVITADNKITKTAHGLTSGIFLEYDNYAGTNIGNLYRSIDLIGATSEVSNGVYEVVVLDANNYQLKYTNGSVKGDIVDFSTQGAGTHIFTRAMKTQFSKYHPNKYSLDRSVLLTKDDESESKLFREVDLDNDPVGILPEVENTTIGTLDPMKTILAKIIKDVTDLKPPAIWLANRFYHFKASDLVGDFDNAEAVDVLPTINFVGSGSFELTQATAGLKGKLYLDDGNGSPYLRMDNNQGYAGNEDFPLLTAGFAWALIARVSPSLDLAGYYTALNDNIGGGGSYIDANWVFNTSYGGTTRWNNSGIIGTIATVKNVKEIWLGRTGTHSKLEKNGADLTTVPTNGETTKPARLNLGNPYTTNSQSAFLDVYEIIFWADDLTDEIGAAFFADNMALQGIG